MSFVQNRWVEWVKRLRQESKSVAGLSSTELALLGTAVRPDSIAFSVRSGSCVDVGSWISRRRVRVVVSGEELVLLAPGPRPYVESVSFEHLRESLYNHVTGELVLGPCENVRVRRLRMSPLDARRLLASILGEAAASHRDPFTV